MDSFEKLVDRLYLKYDEEAAFLLVDAAEERGLKGLVEILQKGLKLESPHNLQHVRAAILSMHSIVFRSDSVESTNLRVIRPPCLGWDWCWVPGVEIPEELVKAKKVADAVRYIISAMPEFVDPYRGELVDDVVLERKLISTCVMIKHLVPVFLRVGDSDFAARIQRVLEIMDVR